MAQKCSCCEPAARLSVPAGYRVALPAPFPSPGREQGPRASPAHLRPRPLRRLPACSHTCSRPLNSFMRKTPQYFPVKITAEVPTPCASLSISLCISAPNPIPR